MSKDNVSSVPKGGKGIFVQDESGHWYFIPVDHRERFDEWSQAADEPDHDCMRYDDCRIGGGPGREVVIWTGEES